MYAPTATHPVHCKHKKTLVSACVFLQRLPATADCLWTDDQSSAGVGQIACGVTQVSAPSVVASVSQALVASAPVAVPVQVAATTSAAPLQDAAV